MKYAWIFIMALVCTLDAIPTIGYSQQQTDRLDSPYYRLVDNTQQSRRFDGSTTNRNAYTGLGTDLIRNTAIRARTRIGDGVESVRRLGKTIKGEQSAPEVNRSDKEVKFVPELIKKNGHQDNNYAIIITTIKCPWCKLIYPDIKTLREEGYLIYVFEATKPEFRSYPKKFEVKAYPTAIVYKDGKQVAKKFGKIPKSWMLEHLKLPQKPKTNKINKNLYKAM